MKIRNFTPHPINIIGNKGTAIFESEGQIRLKAITESAGSVAGILLTKTVFGEPEGLPAQEAGTLLIVSQIVKSACASRDDLCVPAEVVRDGKGQIIGCKSLGR